MLANAAGIYVDDLTSFSLVHHYLIVCMMIIAPLVSVNDFTSLHGPELFLYQAVGVDSACLWALSVFVLVQATAYPMILQLLSVNVFG